MALGHGLQVNKLQGTETKATTYFGDLKAIQHITKDSVDSIQIVKSLTTGTTDRQYQQSLA